MRYVSRTYFYSEVFLNYRADRKDINNRVTFWWKKHNIGENIFFLFKRFAVLHHILDTVSDSVADVVMSSM